MAYADDRTPAETNAGFSNTTAQTGYGSVLGGHEEATLVVKPLGGERRAVKCDDVPAWAGELDAWLQEGEDHMIYTLEEIAAMWEKGSRVPPDGACGCGKPLQRRRIQPGG